MKLLSGCSYIRFTSSVGGKWCYNTGVVSCVLLLFSILTSWVESMGWPRDRVCVRFLPLSFWRYSWLNNCCKETEKKEKQVLLFPSAICGTCIANCNHGFLFRNTSATSGRPCWFSSGLEVFFVSFLLSAGCCCSTCTVGMCKRPFLMTTIVLSA